MKTFARYATFKEGELEATLHGLDPKGQHRQFSGRDTGRSKSGIIKSHDCMVTYPDATTGTCHYLRGGPGWHIFRFEHTSARSGKTASLPVQNETERIGNTLAAIEDAAQKLATKAFSEAIERENRDYFRRVVPPYNCKVVDGEHPQMKAKEAKQASGRYALCIRVGRSLLPTGDSLSTMDEAVESWKTGSDRSRIVGCCCRFKRRWEEPSYNPLHGDSSYPAPFSCPDHESGQKGAKVATVRALMAVPDEIISPHCDWDAPPEDDEDDASPDPLWEGDDDDE